ncbi:type IV pilin protein [Cocleimonas flava]|nr:type IV pilin protein [Cocleimonas flava]
MNNKNRCKMNNRKFNKGFTLMELMIVVAILGIIAAISIPSYMEHVKKSKRTDAKVELLRIAQIQESYYAQNLSYASSLTAARNAGGLGMTAPVMSEQDNYAIELTALPAACGGTAVSPCTSYTLTADAQAKQNDSHCDNFTITNTGLKRVSADGGSVDRSKECWK